MGDKSSEKEANTNGITVGDTTATRNVLFKLGTYIDEAFRTQKIHDKLNADMLKFYWCHENFDIGVYDRNYGVPKDLKELHGYMEGARFDGTELAEYTVVQKANSGVLPTDFAKTGQLVDGERFYVRKALHTSAVLNPTEQDEALEIFSNFFAMGSIGQPKFESIADLLKSDTLHTVRKGLRATFSVIWKYLPDVSYLKERFARGKIHDLESVMTYITDITGCKKSAPDLTRFFSLYNSIPRLMKAGVDGPSLMTALREEVAPFLKRFDKAIDIGELDVEIEKVSGQEKFGVGMNFVMMCHVFGCFKPSEFSGVLDRLGLRINKEVDTLEVEDVMIKKNKRIWYKEWASKTGQEPKFKIGVWNKSYASNKDAPWLDYISKENLKSSTHNKLEVNQVEEGLEDWLVEDLESGEIEICAFRDLKDKLRGGGKFTRGPARNRESFNRTNKWVNNTQKQGFGMPPRGPPGARAFGQRRNFGDDRRRLREIRIKGQKRSRAIFQGARNRAPRYRDAKAKINLFSQSEFEDTINALETDVTNLLEDITLEDEDFPGEQETFEEVEAVELDAPIREG